MTKTEASALIGHTGFVGSNLANARSFEAFANSKTVDELAGRSFDLVVCAGVSAVKWLANKDPETDRRGIARLTSVLETVKAREFVLVSTIDVYPDPGRQADETEDLAATANHAYGRHRLELEDWIRQRFEKVRVVRLPALFGNNLKKNVIFDLLHDNQTVAINPAGIFQWYSVRRLADDIDRIRAADLSLVNLFPEPVATADMLAAFFPGAKVGAPVVPAPHYRLQTKYSDLFGGPNGFHSDRRAVLGELADFIASERTMAG